MLLLAVRRDVRVLSGLSGLLLLGARENFEREGGCTHTRTNTDKRRRSLHTYNLSYLFIREISTMVTGLGMRDGKNGRMGDGEFLEGLKLVAFEPWEISMLFQSDPFGHLFTSFLAHL